MKKLIVATLACLLVIGILYLNQNSRSGGEVAGLDSSAEAVGEIRGLVIPHHEVAHSLINQAIAEVVSRRDRVERIILLGPNHSGLPESFVMTSPTLLQYSIDEEAVKQLSQHDFVLSDTDFLLSEHSMMIPLQFLSEAYSEAMILPLAVSPSLEAENLEILIADLEMLSDIPTLVVLSADFSHNSTIEEGFESHQTMKDIFTQFDYETLATVDDSYIDAPVPTAIFMRLMQSQKAQKWTLIEESHGGLILDNPELNGTSYMTSYYSQSAE